MEAAIGFFALVLAMFVAATQAVVPLIGAYWRDVNLMAYANYAAVVQLGLVGVSFACLAFAFIISDFSLLVVAMNSNSQMPMLYKFTAVWGNHEGSLLLWVLILTIFGGAVAMTGENLPATLKARVLAIQSAVATGFLALIVFTTNPFVRLNPAALDGQELNPLLQDIGLAIHPPFLYLGYVGFSITFAFAIAALIEGRVDAAWARFVRPWVLAAWCFLTIGITLGSYWAYYELGWGGWWFWDPVENASLMPWIVGTALLHSALVVEKRQALIVWTLLLAILTFSLSLIGTFIVRSGVLTSVHAFATDPSRGIGVLILLALVVGGGLTLFTWRSSKFGTPVLFSLISREGGLVLNNIILVTVAGTVFLGTFYPLLIDLIGSDKISVGAPYFNMTFGPLMIFLSIVVVLGPFLRWKRDTISDVLKRAFPAVILVLGGMVLMLSLVGLNKVVVIFSVCLGAWVLFGSLLILTQRIRLFRVSISRSLQLLRTTPRAVFGMVLSHGGLGMAIIGITCVSAWDQEKILNMKLGQIVDIAEYSVTLESVSLLNGPNYQAERGSFSVSKNGQTITQMTSEKRYYPVSQRVTTEAGIYGLYLDNIYIAIGDSDDNGNWVVRLYWHPFVQLIWFGPMFMALGGFVSLSDRRFRIGAPQKSRAPKLGSAVVSS